jgi:arylsulfatase A-like enzyme
LAGEEQTVAEAFRDHGYLTAAWVQNSHLRGFMGFGQGFVQYHDQQGDIARIHRHFTRWVRGPAAGYPFFVYLHYIDLHDPYRPPPPYDTMFGERVAPELYAGVDFAHWGAELAAIRDGERTLSPAEVEQLGRYYDGQIRAIDDRIGELVAELKRRGLYDDTVIVLTADHGDALYEHGFIAHSTVPYEELARVPLIVKLPAQRSAGTRIQPQVRLVDVYPTLLDLAGIGGRSPGSAVAGGDAALAGCSLVPLIRLGERPPEMAGCAQAVIEIAEEGAYPVVAVRSDRYKYIHHQHRLDELYDLAADPGERHNLMVDETGAPRPPEELTGEPAELRHRALAAVAARGQRKAEEIQLDPETIRELQALGYL